MYFKFDCPIEQHQQQEMAAKVLLLSEEITGYRFVYQHDKCIGIEIDIDENKAEELCELLKHIYIADIRELREIENHIVWKRIPTVLFNAHDIVERNGMGIRMAKGEVAISGLLLELFDFFASLFATISCSLFNCKRYRFPTLLKTDVLKTAGYFEHTPNLWMPVMRLRRGMGTYSKFVSDKNVVGCETTKDYMKRIDDCLIESQYSLPPTMCYYIYDMIQEKSIEDSAFMAVGKSFRYEAEYEIAFERLWDFTIHETVFLGSKDYVKSNINNYMMRLTKLMDILDMGGVCQSSNDPFYMTDRTAARVNVQKMLKAKYELQIDISKSNRIAVASFNNHEQFISTRFKITQKVKEDYAYSACAGIGLERFVFAFIAQHGDEEKFWPDIFRGRNPLGEGKNRVIYDIIHAIM